MSERVAVDVHICQEVQDEVAQSSDDNVGSYKHNEVVEKKSKTCPHDQPKDCDDNTRGSKKGSTALATGSRHVDKAPAETDINERMESDQPDVFFSYSSKDREWVHQTASRLETEHGIVCSYDNRDFVGGKTITSNIMKCIQICRKTVLIISPNFLRSPWCEYEMQMVLREHLFREQKVVIPVVLHDCIIPDFISHLTYLEVKDPQFWEKFLEILKSDGREEEGLSEVYSFGYESDKFNGKTIAQTNTSTTYWSSTYDSSRIHETLSSRGIRVTLDDVDGAVKAMTGDVLGWCFCCYICCQSRCLNIFRIACMIFTPLFVTTMIIMIVIINGGGDIFPVDTTGQKCIASVILVCFAIFIVILLGSYFMVKRTRRKVETAANLKLLDHSIIMGFMRTNRWTGAQALQVVYFKTRKCLDTLQRYLRDKEKKSKDPKCLASSIEDGVASDVKRDHPDTAPLIDVSDIECASKDNAKLYIAEICGDYIRKINDQKLRNPVIGQRHTRQGLCLCQYVQSEKFSELV